MISRKKRAKYLLYEACFYFTKFIMGIDYSNCSKYEISAAAVKINKNQIIAGSRL